MFIWSVTVLRKKRSHTRIGFCIYLNDKYQPLLIESRKDDCKALLSDIEIFSRYVVRFFITTNNIEHLNEGIRLLYTTSRYLQDVLMANTFFPSHASSALPTSQKEKIPTQTVEVLSINF